HLVEAGVTWKSEAIFQEEVGNPIARPRTIRLPTTAPRWCPTHLIPRLRGRGLHSSPPTMRSKFSIATASNASLCRDNRAPAVPVLVRISGQCPALIEPRTYLQVADHHLGGDAPPGGKGNPARPRPPRTPFYRLPACGGPM